MAMARCEPKILWRVRDANSYGTNSANLFSPGGTHQTTASSATAMDAELFGSDSNMVRNIVLGRPVPNNPYVLWTSSLLFNLAFASYKRALGQKNIHITCIDPGQAKSVNKGPVELHNVGALLQKYRVELHNRSDGSLRKYDHEYAIKASFVPGSGSAYVDFETLVNNGLPDLLPELFQANERGNHRLHLVFTDLRQ